MGLVFRGSLWRRWSRRASVVVCGLALVSLPAWAQGPPQPPMNSDIAFRLLPTKYDSLQMSPEVLQEQPLVRLLTEAASSYFGFDMLDDLGRAFDGTVVGAVLSDAKKGSSLAAVFADQDLRSQRELVVSELRALASDLESYKGENESYPEDFRKFIDEYRYYEPSLPEGVSYDYQRTTDGFRLVATFAAPSRLAELGPAPIFGADYSEEHVLPERAALSLNFVLGARVADANLAKQVATELMGEPKGGFWSSPDEPPMVATLRGPWLVLSNNKANLGLLLKSLNGQAPGLSKNPSYQLVAKNIDMNAAGMMYVDLPKILKSMPIAESPDQQRILDLLGPTGYAITPYERSQLRVEVFMGVKPPKGSELEAVFAGSARAQAQAESGLVATNIPWDVSNAFAMDYQLSKRLFDAVVALSDETKQTMETVEDVWAGYLGLDAEAGFNQLIDGWVVVSFERLDIFVNAFEGFTEAMTTMPELPPELEGTGGPESDEVTPVFDADGNLVEPDAEAVEVETEVVEESSDSAQVIEVETEVEAVEVEPAAEIEVVEADPEVELEVVEVAPPAPAKPPRLPFTVAFQVQDEQARSALLEALTKQLGEQTKTTTMNGVEVLGREDGLLSYALRDNWFYISGGKTQRLLRNLLAAATGRKATLTSLDTWNRFRAGQKGEVLAIGHQKVDAVYSMVKGALLLMGPDFRPLAEELGGLRDYHSAAFLVPDGLLLVGDVLQGETKP